ncbi:MAG: site-specific integrase, partial [Tannerellaceae bacterium]|nr:site-specific integrase [Tannerellaceae bacterium]
MNLKQQTEMDEFVSSLSAGACSAGHYRKRGVYRSTLHRVKSFSGDVHLSLDTVFAPRFLSDFQEHLLMDGLCRNTVSFYINTLRSVHGAAVNAGILPAVPGLFSPLFTGHTPTQKRALSAGAVARLPAADLSSCPRLERCRDMFMASLCLQGISFVDLLYLSRGDLLAYTRRKTGTQVTVYVLDEAREYLSRLIGSGSEARYLLPVITLSGEDGYRQYQSALHLFNKQLKTLAAHLGLSDNLTSYVTRHTWATLAHHNGVGVSLVSQAMGHTTEKTTRVYLSSFDRKELKGANQAVLDAVLRPIREGTVTDVREEVVASLRTEEREERKEEREEKREEINMDLNAGVQGDGISQLIRIEAIQAGLPLRTSVSNILLYVNGKVVNGNPPVIPCHLCVNTPLRSESGEEKEKEEHLSRAERRRREKEQRKEQEKQMRQKKRKMSVF